MKPPGYQSAALGRRRRAAELAREQGAVALGRDVRIALEAYERAAAHDPSDTWTQFIIGDLHVLLGDLRAAEGRYRIARAITDRHIVVDREDRDAQRELSVSHERIGNVRVAQGNLASALTEFEKSLAIREALAAWHSRRIFGSLRR